MESFEIRKEDCKSWLMNELISKQVLKIFSNRAEEYCSV